MIFADPALDANHNTTRPADAALALVWDRCGVMGGFVMAAVSRRHFITAGHVGGSPGDTITLLVDGSTRTITARSAHPTLDVAVLTVSSNLEDWFPLSAATLSTSQAVRIIGGGVTRGAEVDPSLGWLWGSDGRPRWGSNILSSVAAQTLTTSFTTGTGTDEMQATTGDSGGPMLALESGVWRLAGVVYGVSRSGSAQFGDTTYAERVSALSAWLDPIISSFLNVTVMSKSNYLELKVLDHVLGGPDYTRPATVYLAASTVDPGESGSALAEPSGNNYSRVVLTNNSTNFPAASAGVKSNGTLISFPAATGAWGVITHYALMDASSAGNILYRFTLTVSKAPTSGDTLTVPIGQLSVTED